VFTVLGYILCALISALASHYTVYVQWLHDKSTSASMSEQ